ncbi:hypothetical protein Q2406_00795 (plasmid) [Klebsiella pneumoniae]|nr:hypothetical protein [Klebsiella pneumoniae]
MYRSGTAASSGVIFQAGLGNDGIRQIIGRRHAVDGGKPLFQQMPVGRSNTRSQFGVSATASDNSLASFRVAGNFSAWHQVLIKVLELA